MARVASHAADESDGESDAGEGEAAGDNHADDARCAGAQGHAESDFAAALGDRVGEHAVEADGREDQRERGEGSEQSHLLLAVGDVEVDDFVHGAELGDGLVGIDGGDDAADGGSDGVAGRAAVRMTR